MFRCQINQELISSTFLGNYQVFLPTDTQLDNLQNNFKFSIQLTLKSSYMFRCQINQELISSTFLRNYQGFFTN